MALEKGAEFATLSKPVWLILKAVSFIVLSFVFSAIFWWTKKWIDKKPKKRR